MTSSDRSFYGTLGKRVLPSMISGLLIVSYRSAVGTLDLQSEPEEPVRAERGRDRGTGRPKAYDMPEPGERERAYETIRAHVSAETAEQAGAGRRPDGRYWEEAPRLLDRAAEHRERWPTDRRPAPDRLADPPGSFRSRGGFYLSPERHAEAVAAIGRVREAEPAISADMRAAEQENRHGGWLEGFEHRRKGGDRLKEKAAERLEGEPDKTPASILRNVPDAIR